MVLQRRLDYGFNGYQVPEVPGASRSARGKGPVRKKYEDKQTHPFDVLASVAGNFMQEGESSGLSDATCKIGQHDIVTSCVKWVQEDSKQFCQGCRGNYEFNEILHESIRFKGGLASKKFDHSEEIHVAKELEAISGKNTRGSPFSKVGSKHFGIQGEGVVKINTESQFLNSRSIDSGTPPVQGSLKDKMETGCNPTVQVTSGSTLKMPLLRDFMALGPFPENCADLKVVSRDNDKNFDGCSQHCTIEKTHRPLLYSVDRRTSNLSDSRHWKVAPNLKVGGHFGAADMKTPIDPSGRFCDDHERSQKIFPFKKRKFFDQIPDSMSDACHRNAEFNSSDKRLNGGHYHSDAQNATAAFCSAAGQKVSSESRDCNVKLSIKSFKVPELFVEIPATATVGSLKRTVMEAVTAILGDGLHVGILVQGKKVRDDSKTLLQTGISQNSKHRALGFMLEPKHAQMMPPACMNYPPFQSSNVPGRPIRRTSSLTLQPGTSSVSSDPPKFDFESCLGSDLDVVPSLADASTDNAVLDSRALVVVPPITTKAFAVVPFHRKSNNPEFGQRRIRRPFSVPEVEALVQAVEKLGTGRWRDVKMCAFDNANHRTYVDLKDKWKTLVHTARISPQQRRGEQVPQELLDRVLAAHAYWSQHQVRQ